MKDILLYIRFAIRYAVDNRTLGHVKQFPRWYKDKRSGDNTLARALPWMTYDAIDFLGTISGNRCKVFEWGSGGSTLFFAQRCARVVSVEHDKRWSNLVKKKLKEAPHVEYLEIAGEKVGDWVDRDYNQPGDYISKDMRSRGLSFEKYVKAIDRFPEDYFDIVVVDGRARNSCVQQALPHVKEGGYLVVDNADREHYLDGHRELQDPAKWEKKEFQGPVFFQHAFSKTSFFKKSY